MTTKYVVWSKSKRNFVRRNGSFSAIEKALNTGDKSFIGFSCFISKSPSKKNLFATKAAAKDLAKSANKAARYNGHKADYVVREVDAEIIEYISLNFVKVK